MKLFRVLGARQDLFYMDVSAESRLEAYDIAEARNTEDWTPIETDNIIEVIEVEEGEDNG
jgi:hypothetical protein